MTTFDILTLFPGIFDSYFNESILKRARERKLIAVRAHNIRDFTKDKHRKVDDRPYGGGAGMVLAAPPLVAAVDYVMRQLGRAHKSRKLILLSPKGKQFNQKMAYEWAKKFKHFVIISGRYEGIDERVQKILRAEEISIGPYVLTDGDVAAMTLVSSVARLIPGVIRLESLEEESHWNALLRSESGAREEAGLEYPHYTRPDVFLYKGKAYRVPKVLLSGDHKKIQQWREKSRKSY